jgi:hypothetical protein
VVNKYYFFFPPAFQRTSSQPVDPMDYKSIKS